MWRTRWIKTDVQFVKDTIQPKSRKAVMEHCVFLVSIIGVMKPKTPLGILKLGVSYVLEVCYLLLDGNREELCGGQDGD